MSTIIKKIRAEIERLKEMNEEMGYKNERERYEASGYESACDKILYFLDTLKEQPVALEKEYEDFVTSDPVYNKLVNGIVGMAIARHFYELGRQSKPKDESMELKIAIERKWMEDDMTVGEDIDFDKYSRIANYFFNLGRGSSEKPNDHKDFPTTDEEVKEFLATHPKVEVPERYKNPDWVFEKANLDEAAESLADEHGFKKKPSIKSKYTGQMVRDIFIEAVKAGAMWGREQGLIFNTCINNSGHLSIPMGINLPIGEDVIVQIRKKDE